MLTYTIRKNGKVVGALLGTIHIRNEVNIKYVDYLKDIFDIYTKQYIESGKVDYNHPIFKIQTINGIPYPLALSYRINTLYQKGTVLDLLIEDLAKDINYSESTNDVLDILMKVDIKTARETYSISDDELRKQTHNLLDAYFDNNIEKQLELFNTSSLDAELEEMLLTNRNKKFLSDIINSIRNEEKAVFCYGVLHFIGKDNLVGSLRDLGYTVVMENIIGKRWNS